MFQNNGKDVNDIFDPFHFAEITGMDQDLFTGRRYGHPKVIFIRAAKAGKINKIVNHLDVLVDPELLACLFLEVF